MLRHIRLLALDLDYLVFDCSVLKVRALRQSLISFADAIPQDIRLPDAGDAEELFREHGFRWTQFLEIGLDQEQLDNLQAAYRIHEHRLIEIGVGQLYAGVAATLSPFRKAGIALALAADAGRDYLVEVSDRHSLEALFELSLCTEEYGVGGAEEMFEDIMRMAEVNPSETLVLGTRPSFFQAARNLDLLTIGCGWGVLRHDALQDADLQAPVITHLLASIQKADELSEEFAG